MKTTYSQVHPQTAESAKFAKINIHSLPQDNGLKPFHNPLCCEQYHPNSCKQYISVVNLNSTRFHLARAEKDQESKT